MGGYTVQDFIKRGSSVVLGASVTTAVSDVFKISDADSLHLLVKVVCSGFTVGAGITATVQDSANGSTFEATDATVVISAAGTFEMDINIHNATDTQLWPTSRVVVTTTAGSAVTVSSVLVSRRL